MYSDLHIHTTFSDGKNTVEETVLCAIERGMAVIGISDHGYTEFDGRYCIKKEDIPRYKAEVRKIRAKYGDRITVLCGIEADAAAPLDDREDYDYVIGDCHYIKCGGEYYSVDGAREWQRELIDSKFGADSDRFARAYFENYAEKVCALHPDILGHFDLLAKFSFTPVTEGYVSCAVSALRECLKVTPYIELNTGAIARGYRSEPYPAPFLLREAANCGGKIVLASDSHKNENITFWFDEACRLLLSNGIDEIWEMTPCGFAKKKIG